MSRESLEPENQAIQALYDAVSDDAKAVVFAVLELEASNPANIVRRLSDKIRVLIKEEAQ